MVTWNVTEILAPVFNNGVTVKPISGFNPGCCIPPIVYTVVNKRRPFWNDILEEYVCNRDNSYIRY